MYLATPLLRAQAASMPPPLVDHHRQHRYLYPPPLLQAVVKQTLEEKGDAYIYTYIYTYTHTCIHAYTYISRMYAYRT